MKTFIKLCYSIVRRNLFFTIGIFVMSTMSVIIAFLGANFGASSSETIMSYLSESHTPDVVYSTMPISPDAADEIGQIAGVSTVSKEFVYDTNIKTDDNRTFSVRFFSRDKDSPFLLTTFAEKSCDSDEPEVFVYYKFAEQNNLHPGDYLYIDTPCGTKKVVITSLVSNPETIECIKDDMSAYEEYQFAYIFIESKDFEKFIPLNGQGNRWLIYFDDGLQKDAKLDVMSSIRDCFSDNLVSETLIAESEAMNHVFDDIATINVLCAFIPGLVWLLSIGFDYIFIKTIVANQKKTIGLLRALGYSIRKVILLFIIYTVLINLPAVVVGIFIGNKVLNMCVSIIAAAEGVKKIEIVIRPAVSIAMLSMIFLIGILASLMSANAISRIDPSQAYGGIEVSDYEPPKFIARLRINEFFKISVVTICRNLNRQIIGGLCVTACIIFMCVGFGGVLTIGYPIDAVYGGRYCYDLLVRNIDVYTMERIKSEVNGIELSEAVTLFTLELLQNDVRISTVTEDSEMIYLKDADGSRIIPKDGIVIDEMRAKINGLSIGDSVNIEGIALPITGIAREIVYPVQYVSPETAALFGYDEPNCLLLKLSAGVNIKDVKEHIASFAETAYFTEMALQKDNIREKLVPMRVVMFCFALLAFLIGSLLIVNITLIDYNENINRFATLRALGTPIGKVTIISCIQNSFRVLFGILFAIPLSYVIVVVMHELLSTASQQYVIVQFGSCFTLSCVIVLMYILFGMLMAQYKIRKMDFCNQLNKVE